MGVQPSGPKMMAAHSAVGWLIGRSSSTRFGRRVRSLVIVEVATVSARRSIPNGRPYPTYGRLVPVTRRAPATSSLLDRRHCHYLVIRSGLAELSRGEDTEVTPERWCRSDR